MSISTQCDTCGRQLDNSGPMPDYMFTVEVMRVPNLDGYEFSLLVTPPHPVGRYDFCSERCLKEWVAE